jgi:hypothetical protein
MLTPIYLFGCNGPAHVAGPGHHQHRAYTASVAGRVAAGNRETRKTDITAR